jgi:DNA polymerase-3 subunit gamma/tau
VQAALRAFPGAKLKVQSREDKAQAAEAEALPEVPDEWDPFEEG